MKVVKFGGSSLAPGKRNSDDTKVTDLLITYAYTSLRSNNYQDIVNKIYSATN